jgi:hypothetical protein
MWLIHGGVHVALWVTDYHDNQKRAGFLIPAQITVRQPEIAYLLRNSPL